MFRRGVHCEPAPEPASVFFSEPIRRRLAGVGGEIVEDQMDGVGGGISSGDVEQEFGEFG